MLLLKLDNFISVPADAWYDTMRSLLNERNSHLPVPGLNCMTHHQAQAFLDSGQVSLHTNSIINFPVL
jgi:hypothetical protein